LLDRHDAIERVFENGKIARLCVVVPRVIATSKHAFAALLGSAVKASARRGLAISLFGGLLLGILGALPASSAPGVQLVTSPVASPGWLGELNAWRASTGTSLITENSTWSAGDYNHAVYMVKNGQVTHYETPGLPYYTPEGDTAARNSNIVVSSSTSMSDQQAIDWWMGAPFHSMGLTDPRLTSSGFGSYRDGTTSPWQFGAAVDTLRGNSFTGGQYPVFFPGNGSTETLTSYSGNEFPDPLQACPGYALPTGLPVFVQVGGGVATTAGPVHSFTGNGTPLAHCVIDSNSPSVGSNLTGRGGVILIPRQPLQVGVNYVVALTVNGVPYTWSFTVGTVILPPLGVTGVAPNGGGPAGGTTVTITGNGFSTGTTSVKFGTSAAASFAVVNDSTLTAVTPAHAAGTVNVSVTTSRGTSPASPLDQFTFGACTSATATAAPPSPAMPGTAITITAVASGCSSPLYQFWFLAPGGGWTIAQAYSSSATFSWNTTGKALGVYYYSVWARDAGSAGTKGNGLGSYDAYVPGTAYTLTSTFTGCPSVTASAAPPSPSLPGTAVTFTASASGCPNPRYEFWTLAPGGAWTIAQAYSSNAAFSWTTTGLPGGIYHYSVWVRDASSAAGYDAYTGTAYTLTSTACASVTASAAPASPQAPGTSVMFTAIASGCSNPRYQFWTLAPGGAWMIAQGYSSSATFNWSTTGLAAGSYRYSVWVRDAGSSAGYDAYFPGTAYTLTAPCSAVTASASPASPQAHGSGITFTASASGCSNPRYQFWILAPGGSWTMVQAYSSSATFPWATTGLPAGTYHYSVWVRDASSSGSYDSYFPGAAYVLT
jgi:hypothetical protein